MVEYANSPRSAEKAFEREEVQVTKEKMSHEFGDLRRILLVVGVAVTGLLLLMLIPDAVHSSEIQQALPEGWQDLVNENFDTGSLGANWTVTSTVEGGDLWTVSSSRSSSPSYSVRAVGTDPSYPNNADSWLIYGPIDLSEVFHAEMTFDWWLDTASGDWFGWCVMTDIDDLSAGCNEARISGSIGAWVEGQLSLDPYAMTSTPVYVAFHFTSDDAGAGEGVYVDNVIVRGDYGRHLFLPLVRRDPTPTPSGYDYEFDGATTWQVVDHSGADGPPGTDWFRVRNSNDYLKMSIADRWEHIIASPQQSMTPPYRITAKTYYYQRSWSSGYGFVFGSTNKNFRDKYYRLLAVYISDGNMKVQLKRVDYDGSDRELWGYGDIPKDILNGQEWNKWEIIHTGDRIFVYINNTGVLNVGGSDLSGEGYFGHFMSTWEFQPIEMWTDYYRIQPYP